MMYSTSTFGKLVSKDNKAQRYYSDSRGDDMGSRLGAEIITEAAMPREHECRPLQWVARRPVGCLEDYLQGDLEASKGVSEMIPAESSGPIVLIDDISPIHSWTGELNHQMNTRGVDGSV